MCGIYESLWSRIAPRILTLGLTWFPMLIWILFLFIIIYNIKTRKAFQELGKFTEGVVRSTMSQERLNSLTILSKRSIRFRCPSEPFILPPVVSPYHSSDVLCLLLQPPPSVGINTRRASQISSVVRHQSHDISHHSIFDRLSITTNNGRRGSSLKSRPFPSYSKKSS